MNNYFLHLNDTVHGPLSTQVIESMLRAGTILPDTPVAPEGSSEWTTAGQLFNFQSQPTPPPRPPNVKPGTTKLTAMTSHGLPSRKPKKKSVWVATTAALVVIIALLAFCLFLQAKRANPTATMPSPTATPVVPAMTAKSPPADPIDSAQDLKNRAEAGDAEAQYKFAYTFSNKSDTNGAQEKIQWLKKAAEQGHPKASFDLGICYTYGKGVAQDTTESLKWHRKAAALGISESCSFLGYQYKYGFGVPKDVTEAAKWYRQGANRDGLARIQLGLLYALGDGVPKDLVQALMWLKLSPAIDCPELKQIREICDKEMTSEQIAEATRLAHEWKP